MRLSIEMIYENGSVKTIRNSGEGCAAGRDDTRAVRGRSDTLQRGEKAARPRNADNGDTLKVELLQPGKQGFNGARLP